MRRTWTSLFFDLPHTVGMAVTTTWPFSTVKTAGSMLRTAGPDFLTPASVKKLAWHGQANSCLASSQWSLHATCGQAADSTATLSPAVRMTKTSSSPYWNGADLDFGRSATATSASG